MSRPRRTRIGLQDRNGIITDDFLELNATISTQHESAVKLTDNPTETGTTITDHRIAQPRVVVLKGTFSNCYVGASGNGGDISGHPTESPQEAWDILKRMQFAKTLVYVTSGLESYSNLVIEKLNVTRDWKTANAIEVTIRLKQVFRAEAKRKESQLALRPAKAKTPKTESKEYKSCVASARVKESAVIFLGKVTGYLSGNSPEAVAAQKKAMEEAEAKCRIQEESLATKREREEPALVPIP